MTVETQLPTGLAGSERHRKSLLAVNLGLAANIVLAALIFWGYFRTPRGTFASAPAPEQLAPEPVVLASE